MFFRCNKFWQPPLHVQIIANQSHLRYINPASGVSFPPSFLRPMPHDVRLTTAVPSRCPGLSGSEVSSRFNHNIECPAGNCAAAQSANMATMTRSGFMRKGPNIGDTFWTLFGGRPDRIKTLFAGRVVSISGGAFVFSNPGLECKCTNLDMVGYGEKG